MKRKLKKLAERALEPVMRWVLNWMELGDPWASSGVAIAHYRISSGSVRSFDWYFQGESAVHVTSLEDILSWLRDCEYESDQSLFNEPDFWQHPRTFERLRRGDCEDHALWSWRKLCELGIEARLFVGRYAASERGHAWVVVRRETDDLLLDPVARDESVLQPLQECRDRYEPWYSVSADLKAVVHYGYLYRMKEQLNLPRRDRSMNVPQQSRQ